MRAAKQALQHGKAAADELVDVRLAKSSNEFASNPAGNEDSDTRGQLAAAVAWRSYFAIEVASVLRSDGELRSATEIVDASVTDLISRVAPVLETTACSGSPSSRACWS